MLFILILLVAFILQFFLPWWIVAIVAFVAAFLKARAGSNAFWSGFFAIGTLWTIVGLFKTLSNKNILANKVGQMLMLPETGFNWLLVLIISALIGALAAGFSALAGYYFQAALRTKKAAN